MRKLAGTVGLSLCLGLAPHPASAAGSDGRWIAELPAQGRCNFVGQLTVVVAGGAVSGELDDVNSGGSGRLSVTGALGPDGRSTVFTIDHRFAGAITFRDDHFDATWTNENCARHAVGERAPDDAAVAATAEERKRRQAAFTEEVRRAKAGEAVDFGQIRTDVVYTRDWQFFDGKAQNLLNQADAAVKGKDCAQALPVLDEVLAMEFINDSAHALRADCLRQTGDADKARIEDGIAKGLIHSLMDSWSGAHNSGQARTPAGSTEESAYVISTMFEERDVLANRHIELKTRQTDIRGSNGRYYELVHGVSISGSGVATDATGHDIYFDITAFVTGRVSRRAAAQVLQAELQ